MYSIMCRGIDTIISRFQATGTAALVARLMACSPRSQTAQGQDKMTCNVHRFPHNDRFMDSPLPSFCLCRAADLTRKLRVWLRADRGVNGQGDTTVTRMEDGAHSPVATWTSVTPGKKAEETAEDSSVVFRALNGAAQQRSEKKWRDGVVQDRKMVEKGEAKDGRTRAAPPGR